jgi:lipid A 3-O-deacylase
VSRSIRVLAAAAALASLPGVALSEGASAQLASLTLENDFFAGYDHHYTNGVQAAFVISPRTVFAVGQRIFTPADTDTRFPDPADRPYAGWLYGMADIRLPAKGTIDHLTVSLGVVGPYSLGRQAQNLVHRALGNQESQGWDSQVGSEITAMVGYDRAWPNVWAGRLGSHSYDLALRAGGAVGNVLTYVDAGAVLRYGRNLPDDIPVTFISLGPPRDGYRGTGEFGWYVWAGFDGRGVARNIFLDGNTFRDGPHVERKPFGYDMQVGAALAWPKARVGFTLIQRSREFDGQQGHDRFGQLVLSFAY